MLQVEVTSTELAGLQEIAPGTVPFEEVTACPVCETPGGLLLAELQDSLHTAWCETCGHAFRSRRPTAEWFRSWYTTDWDDAQRTDRLRTAVDAAKAWRISRMRESGSAEVAAFCRPASAKGATVLDVGCGYGDVLRPFAREGWKIHGLELSPPRARAARLLGAQVAEIPVEDLRPDTFGRAFDLTVCRHVLEHITEPIEWLERIRAVTRPGGWLYVGVPNLANDFLLQHAFYALHVHAFSRSSLTALLARAGFVAHRWGEDHQLQVLARLEESPVAPVDAGAPPELERFVGPIANGAAETTCAWSLLNYSRQLRDPYAISFGANPTGRRSVHLRRRDGDALPVRYVTPGGATPFWVK